MNIKKELRGYYHNKIEAQKIPTEIEFFKTFRMEKVGQKQRAFFQGLAFNLSLILFFGFIVILNSNTYQSLRRIDPDSQKSHYLEQKLKKGLGQIRAYFKPYPTHPNKGGRG